METEIMETNTNEENHLNLEIPLEGKFTNISEAIDERIEEDTVAKLSTNKYKKKYENPQSSSAQIEVNKFVKSIRPKVEEEFQVLKDIIKEETIDEKGVTEDIDCEQYLSIQQGTNSNLPQQLLSSIRGVFANASIILNQKLKDSVTSKYLYNMLFYELSEKIRGDYRYLVWQLS